MHLKGPGVINTHTQHGNTLPQVTGKTGKSVRVATMFRLSLVVDLDVRLNPDTPLRPSC